jgi:tRNA(Ile)-lysidine synthase
MTISLEEAIDAFSPAFPLAVAYSGGADSTALLLACARKWPGQVHALHVHHGLQQAADEFETHCRAFCAGIAVPLSVLHVNAKPAPGDSPEDAARRTRYKAFHDFYQSQIEHSAIYSIALAQHADDQVETLVLALSRGAGLAGLSAMPATWQRDGIRYHRPLLSVSQAALRQWLTDQDVAFVTDPSNANQAFTRNRIRARLLPLLDDAFPQFRDTFARSAAHAAGAQSLLTELAQEDLVRIGTPPTIVALQGLSPLRMANLLRHWLKVSHGVVPSTAQLQELVHQIAACTSRAHQIHLKVGQGFVERKHAVLHWYNPTALHQPPSLFPNGIDRS